MARQARIALAISMMACGCAMVSRLPANVRRSQNAKGLPKLRLPELVQLGGRRLGPGQGR
jgi:hypothetical protein